MNKIVGPYDRIRANEAAVTLLKHQVNRIWDTLSEVDAAIDDDNPQLALELIHNISGLSGGAKTQCHIWIGLRMDHDKQTKHEASQEILRQEREKPAEAPEVIAAPESAGKIEIDKRPTAAAGDIPF